MDRRTLTLTTVAAAVALAAGVAAPASAQQMTPVMQKKLDMMLKQYPDANKQVIEKNIQRVAAQHLQRCFGVNALGRNDCASGAHSCAGLAKSARDPSSFVLLPAGDCGKLAGGSLTPSKA
ncbi:MAG: DUF2282 domain-containing protein [Rhodobacteraceae bacterium]|nr:DUF2282 domain-containing protein [Paracoccaceae bacterium]